MLRKYKKTNVICEGHELIESIHTLSLSEIRVIQLCLADIYQLEGVKADTLYNVPIQTYADMFNISYESAYNTILGITDSILKRIIVFKSSIVDANAPERSIDKTHWVEKFRYNPDKATIEIMWGRDLVFLLGKFDDGKRYAKYYLENTRKFQSIHSIRLYRLANKWRVARGHEYSLEEFRQYMGFTQGEYPIFADLRKVVIEPAVKEINEHSDIRLQVTYIPEKTGVKKTDIRFKLEVKKDA